MNRKLSAVVLSAAIVGGIGAAAVPASSAFADGGSAAGQSTRPTLDQATQQLVTQAGTSRVSVVDGIGYSGDQIYFGAVVTGHDTIAFYVNPGDGWGKSSERAVPQGPYGDDVQIYGWNLQGVQYPVFVAKGSYTLNGELNAIAYGHDRNKGWGVLVGKGKTLVPSGRGIDDASAAGPEIGIKVTSDHQLETRSLWAPSHGGSTEDQLRDPIVRTWKGTGGDTLTMTSQRGGPFD